jgi:hypothetical protein
MQDTNGYRCTARIGELQCYRRHGHNGLHKWAIEHFVIAWKLDDHPQERERSGLDR